MMPINRRWLLVRRPEGALRASDLLLDEQPLTPPALTDGEVLVRTRMFSCAPTMRNFMNDPSRSYRASVALGEPAVGVAGGVVEQSMDLAFPVGSRLTGTMHWADYCVLKPGANATPVARVPKGMAWEDALGVFGHNALTGYFGMTRVACPQPGECVVVSAAAGATGSVAAQIAKIAGARVIGIAGGPGKCARLLEELGLDGAIDYKNEDVRSRLAILCPAGVNAFFDNVGGEILQSVVDQCALHARVAVCGQVSAYDSDHPAPGPRDMMKIVYGRIRIQGFVRGDFALDTEAALADLRRWRDEGKLRYRIDLRQGFEQLPRAFMDLFTGANDGALLVQS